MADKLYPIECGGCAPPVFLPRDDARCAALLACYRSGQIDEVAWQDHLRHEPGLAEYAQERAP